MWEIVEPGVREAGSECGIGVDGVYSRRDGGEAGSE